MVRTSYCHKAECGAITARPGSTNYDGTHHFPAENERAQRRCSPLCINRPNGETSGKVRNRGTAIPTLPIIQLSTQLAQNRYATIPALCTHDIRESDLVLLVCPSSAAVLKIFEKPRRRPDCSRAGPAIGLRYSLFRRLAA